MVNCFKKPITKMDFFYEALLWGLILFMVLFVATSIWIDFNLQDTRVRLMKSHLVELQNEIELLHKEISNILSK